MYLDLEFLLAVGVVEVVHLKSRERNGLRVAEARGSKRSQAMQKGAHGEHTRAAENLAMEKTKLYVALSVKKLID